MKQGREYIWWKGKVMRSEMYQQGILDGPCEYHESIGSKETGQYVNGKKCGEWKSFNPQGKLIQSMTWKEGVLHGLYHQQGDRRWLLSDGRLVVDDAAKRDGFAELFDKSQIDNRAIRVTLASLTRIEFIETPLQDACDFLQAQHGIPIQTDPFHANGKQSTSGAYRNLDLASLLTILMADHGHACDYRYGSVWITTPEDAKNWRDPTGVAKIEPPADSQLAKSWYEPVSCKAINQPLAELLTNLAQPLAIDVDTSAVQSAEDAPGEYSVTREIWGHPFRHALGILLYQTRCRVKLDGETLVILPPAEP